MKTRAESEQKEKLFPRSVRLIHSWLESACKRGRLLLMWHPSQQRCASGCQPRRSLITTLAGATFARTRKGRDGMNRTKLKRLIHYVCSRCQDNPARLGAVKLNKVIWYVETNHYVKTNGHALTGARFIKEKNGPVVAAMLPLLEELVEDGVLDIRTAPAGNYFRTEYITKTAPDLTLFNSEDLKLIDRMTEDVCAHTATSISDATHAEWWKLAEMGETIPLFAIMATPRAVTDEDRAWADSLITSRFGHEF